MDSSHNNITNLATLTFLTNPLYSKEISKTEKECAQTNKIDRKFYRKRLNTLHKQLLHGDTIDKDIKRAHDEFIRISIGFLKMTDKKDILQTEYDGNEINSILPSTSFNLNTTNSQMMNCKEQKCTLDNFVTSKIVNITPPPPPPQKKKINLKDEKLRKKGIKKKN